MAIIGRYKICNVVSNIICFSLALYGKLCVDSIAILPNYEIAVNFEVLEREQDYLSRKFSP